MRKCLLLSDVAVLNKKQDARVLFMVLKTVWCHMDKRRSVMKQIDLQGSDPCELCSSME